DRLVQEAWVVALLHRRVKGVTIDMGDRERRQLGVRNESPGAACDTAPNLALVPTRTVEAERGHSGGGHPNLADGGIPDHPQLAGTGLACRHLLAALPGDPCLPNRPPRVRQILRASEPVVGIWRQLVVFPMAVFGLGRRIDDAGDVTRRRQYEFTRPAEN